MPIYGYHCRSCEHRFDALQKMSEPNLVDCPECGEASLRKELSAPKFRLKGKGWYETDFKTGDKRNLAGDGEKSSGSKEADKGADKGSDKDSDKSVKKADKKADSTTASPDKKAKSA